jgi:hypothetical protein
MAEPPVMIMAVSAAPSRVPATPKREVTKAATAEASPADTTWVGGTVLLTSSNVAAGFCHRLLLTVYRT